LPNYVQRSVVVLALAVVLGAVPAAAQRATAGLRAVESGRIDAGNDPKGSEMCLRPGSYVLAFERAAGNRVGAAYVSPSAVPAAETREQAREPARPLTQRELARQRVEAVIERNRRRARVASVLIQPADQDRWGWVSFNVWGQIECFRLSASNGRARVYDLRVGVVW